MSVKPFGWADASHDIVQVGASLGSTSRALDRALTTGDMDIMRKVGRNLRLVLAQLDQVALAVAMKAAEVEPVKPR